MLHQGIEISDERFHGDVDRLIAAIERNETVVATEQVVVVDGTTRRGWQKDGSARPVGYEDAVAFVRQLAADHYAGFDDWRLPTLEEAMSLMQPTGRDGDYHLDPLFERSAAPFVWTADTDPQGKRWVVYYRDGIAALESAQLNAYVRAVRTHDP